MNQHLGTGRRGLETETDIGVRGAAAFGIAAGRFELRRARRIVDVLESGRSRESQPTGPSRTLTLPRKFRGSVISVSSAPGMQGAMRRTSRRIFHASGGGSGTSNELSNSMNAILDETPAQEPGTRPLDRPAACAAMLPGRVIQTRSMPG